jgi:hypothetical protein
MLGLELTSETMLYLGITFILSGVLFFYVKKHILHLEEAQMEQAKILQSIIMSLNSGIGSGTSMGPGANTGPGDSIAPTESVDMDTCPRPMASMGIGECNLIDVSDGEDADSDSDADSDDESEGDESEGEGDDDNSDGEDSDEEADSDEEEENNDIKEVVYLNNNINDIDENSIEELHDNVKVININKNTIHHLDDEEIILDDLTSMTDTNIDDDDDDDDDDTNTVNSSVSGNNLAKTSLKALKVGDLRKMVLERGLIADASKVKKAELIVLLQQQ